MARELLFRRARTLFLRPPPRACRVLHANRTMGRNLDKRPNSLVSGCAIVSVPCAPYLQPFLRLDEGIQFRGLLISNVGGRL